MSNQMILAQWLCPSDNNDVLIGVYSTFDKAIEGSDAYCAWMGTFFGNVWFTQVVKDNNHTNTCMRDDQFRVIAGKIPNYHLRSSIYADRFKLIKEK